MSPLVTLIAWLLLPAAVLPVITAIVLFFNVRTLDSPSLRDRWHLSVVMAAVGLVAAGLAANRLFEWGLQGEAVALPLGVVLLAVDFISGKWLIEFWRGRFR